MKHARILLADPHHLERKAIRTYIEKASGFRVIGDASNSRETLRLIKILKPDILILEPLVMKPDDLELVCQVRANDPTLHILVLSRCKQPWMLQAMLEKGVSGYILKEESTYYFLDALRGLAKGKGGWISPGILNQLHTPNSINVNQARQLLTSQEWRVMLLAAKGLQNREIAEQLFISVGTVKIHISNLLMKLKMKSRLKLITWAHENDLFHIYAPTQSEKILDI